MNCEHAESLMVDYLYGELSDDIAIEFFQHLKECNKCTEAMRELKCVSNLMKEIPEISEPSVTWRSPFWVNRSEKSRLKWYLVPAAVIIFAVLSLFVILNTSFKYDHGVVSLEFGTGKQKTLPEDEINIAERKFSYDELEPILKYINYLENKQAEEQIIITGQLENLAYSTLHEFRKRDEMLQWLITNSVTKVDQQTLQEERWKQ